MTGQHIDVRVAETSEKTIVRDLLGPYLRELRAFTGGEPNPNGPFTYPYLDRYWPPDSEIEGRVPFLIRVNGEIAGFILKSTWSNVAGKASAHAIAEFFVVEPWQGQGAGRVAAHAVFDRFPGRWEIAALDANHAAKAFWRRVINEYTGGAFEEIALDTDAWHGPVWRFETPFNEASYTQGDRCTCRPVSRPAARPAAKEDS